MQPKKDYGYNAVFFCIRCKKESFKVRFNTKKHSLILKCIGCGKIYNMGEVKI